jgi:hypothetical protein
MTFQFRLALELGLTLIVPAMEDLSRDRSSSLQVVKQGHATQLIHHGKERTCRLPHPLYAGHPHWTTTALTAASALRQQL